jgi:hypothetical protein
MEQHYFLPEEIFLKIKQYVDGRGAWREKDKLIEIKTSSKSLQEFLSKITSWKQTKY